MNISQQNNRALPDIPVQTGTAEFFPGNGIGFPQKFQTITSDGTNNPDTQARTREGLTLDYVVRQTQLGADGPYFILEKSTKRFNELKIKILRQAAYIVVALNIGCPVSAA